MKEFYPEGQLLNTFKNKSVFSSKLALYEAYKNNTILESKAILCDNEHNLIVNLGCMRGIIPRSEGALGIKEGTVRDIALISRVNRPVCFVITSFKKDKLGRDLAILSRSAAQKKCYDEYISNLKIGDIIDARVTHIEGFGAFADIGCGIVSLIPIDLISISRIDHPRERFKVDMDIKAIIKGIENDRIYLTHKELLGTWQENADLFSPGETVTGIVRSVENYGVFVELTPNLAGLAESKDGIFPKQMVSVYIKNILPQKMKIKLIIINTFEESKEITTPKYFYNKNHIDKFVYSPVNSNKNLETSFKLLQNIN